MSAPPRTAGRSSVSQLMTARGWTCIGSARPYCSAGSRSVYAGSSRPSVPSERSFWPGSRWAVSCRRTHPAGRNAPSGRTADSGRRGAVVRRGRESGQGRDLDRSKAGNAPCSVTGASASRCSEVSRGIEGRRSSPATGTARTARWEKRSARHRAEQLALPDPAARPTSRPPAAPPHPALDQFVQPPAGRALFSRHVRRRVVAHTFPTSSE